MSFPQRTDVDITTGRPPTYDQKWESHKPLLYRLYLEENLKLPEIRNIMRETYNFRAE
jgi:hypothetical protein